MAMKSLERKVALVTGSTKGIGLAVARLLLAEGAKVAINGRDQERIHQAVANLHPKERVLPVSGDVADSDDVAAMVSTITARWGKIDILINNAGVAQFKPVLETELFEWQRMLNINLTGSFLCTKAVLPEMLSQGSGHLVFVLSVAAEKAFQNCSAYAASKAGLRMFANVLREEFRTKNIHVTSVLAGATDTPLWDNIPGEFPRQKMMTAESVAAAIVAALKNPDGMIEELIIRPISGDL